MLKYILTFLILLTTGLGTSAVPVGSQLDLALIEVAATKATVQWLCSDMNSSAMDECQMSYRLQNDTAIIQSSIVPISYTFVLNNLSVNSTYEVYVVCYSADLLHASSVLVFSTGALLKNGSMTYKSTSIPSDVSVGVSSVTSSIDMTGASNASSNISASDVDSIIGIIFGLIAAIIVATCSLLTLRSLQNVRMQRLMRAQESDSSSVPVNW